MLSIIVTISTISTIPLRSRTSTELHLRLIGDGRPLLCFLDPLCPAGFARQLQEFRQSAIDFGFNFLERGLSFRQLFGNN
jgi:hypothetical protein